MGSSNEISTANANTALTVTSALTGGGTSVSKSKGAKQTPEGHTEITNWLNLQTKIPENKRTEMDDE